MTAMENMETQRLLLGIKDKKVCSELLELAGIGNTGKKKAKDYLPTRKLYNNLLVLDTKVE